VPFVKTEPDIFSHLLNKVPYSLELENHYTMAPKQMNEKKQKGMELKASNKSKKDAVISAAAASQEAQEWKKGADNRGADRSNAAGE
jgi:hypothetical protein